MRRIKLNESKLNRIIKESVRRVLKEDSSDVINQFAELLTTGFDIETAKFIANEFARTGQDTLNTMEFIINHFNGYGYGGPDVNGNYDY